MERTQSPDYEKYIFKNRHWNFIVNLLEMSFWTMAMSFVFSSTILPLYTSYLTSSSILIGLIVAVNEVAFFLPQLLSARRIEQLEIKKLYISRSSGCNSSSIDIRVTSIEEVDKDAF